MISKIKVAGQGKKIEKYTSDNAKTAAVFNTEDEVKVTPEFTKKKKQRSKSEDVEEETVPIKKKKKTVQVDSE